ncbi:MAG: hypothetical protein HQ503_19060 [Rhodospirillales bacterium]|nr:hypothetical protein [Rhodospirillales bacterium]
MNTNNIITVALIGCGCIADRHARALVSVGGGELAAVGNVAPDKAQDYGDELGVL